MKKLLIHDGSLKNYVFEPGATHRDYGYFSARHFFSCLLCCFYNGKPFSFILNKKYGMPGRNHGMLVRKGGMPTRKGGMPVRKGGMPERKRGMPTRKVGIPERKGGVPGKKYGMPERKGGMPARKRGMPTRKGGMPVGKVGNIGKRLIVLSRHYFLLFSRYRNWAQN
jgi:hypothetical protein